MIPQNGSVSGPQNGLARFFEPTKSDWHRAAKPSALARQRVSHKSCIQYSSVKDSIKYRWCVTIFIFHLTNILVSSAKRLRDWVSPRNRPRNRPRKCPVRFRFRFFFLNRPKPTDIFDKKKSKNEKRKTDRVIVIFCSQHCCGRASRTRNTHAQAIKGIPGYVAAAGRKKSRQSSGGCVRSQQTGPYNKQKQKQKTIYYPERTNNRPFPVRPGPARPECRNG